jgi:hypothetical protein
MHNDTPCDLESVQIHIDRLQDTSHLGVQKGTVKGWCSSNRQQIDTPSPHWLEEIYFLTPTAPSLSLCPSPAINQERKHIKDILLCEHVVHACPFPTCPISIVLFHDSEELGRREGLPQVLEQLCNFTGPQSAIACRIHK